MTQAIDASSEIQYIRDQDQSTYHVPLSCPERLTHLGYMYHPTLRFFVCVDCKVGIRPELLGSHLEETHQQARSAIAPDVRELLELCPPHPGSHPVLPVFSDKLPMVALPLIPVVDGLLCDLCGYGCASPNTMRKHFSQRHHGVGVKQSTRDHALQLIYTQGTRRYFPVQHPDPPTVDDTPLAAFLASVPAPRRNIIPEDIDQREISSVMGRLGWSEHVKGHDTLQLIALVGRPGADEDVLHRLKSHVRTYLEVGEEALRGTDNVVYHLINSESPNELSHSPFRSLQTASAFDKYSSYFTRIFCFLFRVLAGADCPSYGLSLSPGQEALLVDLLGHLDGQDADPDGFEALFHPLAHSLLVTSPPEAAMDQFSHPLVCFFALSNLRPDGRFDRPDDITSKMAMLQWGLKHVVLRQVRNVLSARGQAPVEEVESIVNREVSVLHAGRISAFSSLLLAKRLLNHLAYKQPGLPSVHWRDRSRTELTVNGTRLLLRDLKAGVHALELELERHLEDQLLLGSGAPPYPDPAKVVDHLSHEDVGYSFVEEVSNPFVEDRWSLVKHIMGDDGLRGHFLGGMTAGRLVWNTHSLRHYIGKCARFIELLAPLVHLTYGAPARRTELLVHKCANTALGLRNLYFINGRLVLISRYHKGSHQTGLDKTIPRFLTGRLTRTLTTYLAYVRPFECYVLNTLNKPEGAEVHRTHLFALRGGLLGKDMFTDLFADATSRHIGSRLNPSSWRHASIAIFKSLNIRQDPEHGQAVEDLQAGHTTRTAEERYALDRDHISSLTDSTFLLFQQSSQEWQDFLGYGANEEHGADREHDAPDARGGPTGGEEHGNREEHGTREMLLALDRKLDVLLTRIDGQARPPPGSGHEPGTPGDTPDARHPGDVPAGVPSDISPPGPAPTRPLTGRGLSSGPPGSRATPLIRSLRLSNPARPPDRSTRVVASRRLDVHPRLIDGLRRIYPPPLTAAWRSDWQEQGAMLVLDGKDNLLIVGPTSSGKTLLWAAPVMSGLETGSVTVVVIPLSALVQDVAHKIASCGVRPVRWTPALAGGHPLVLVSVEQCVLEGFKRWLATVRLTRLVFEEAHLPLTAASYRPVMDGLASLRAFDRPKVLVTATCPPSLTPSLLSKFSLSRVVVHRTSTDRAEVHYSSSRPVLNARNMVSTVHTALRQILPVIGTEGQILMFCRSKADVEALGEGLASLGLACDVHHSDREDRHLVLERFRTGEPPVLISTAGLGAGIDLPQVCVTIHVGEPVNFIDGIQEMGRVGRRGQRSWCHVLRLEKWWGSQSLGAKEMMTMLDGTGCLRRAIGAFMDGEGATCESLPNSRPCGRCAPSPFDAPPPTPSSGGEPGAGPWPPSPDPSLSPGPPGGKAQKTVHPSAPARARHPSPVSRTGSPPPTSSLVGLDSASQIEREATWIDLVEGLYLKISKLKGHCPRCLADGRLSEHPITSCCPADWFQDKLQPWRRASVLQGGKQICFSCWFPWTLGDSKFHGPKVQGARRSCRFPSVLPELLLSAAELGEHMVFFRSVGLERRAHGWDDWLFRVTDTVSIWNLWIAADWFLGRVMESNHL